MDTAQGPKWQYVALGGACAAVAVSMIACRRAAPKKTDEDAPLAQAATRTCGLCHETQAALHCRTKAVPLHPADSCSQVGKFSLTPNGHCVPSGSPYYFSSSSLLTPPGSSIIWVLHWARDPHFYDPPNPPYPWAEDPHLYGPPNPSPSLVPREGRPQIAGGKTLEWGGGRTLECGGRP